MTDKLAAEPNVEVKIKAGYELMHEKDYDIDESLLRSGSANWSFGGLRKQDNIVVYTEAPNEVRRFGSKFREMWDRPDLPATTNL